jgi:hypothetical protein
MKQRISSLPALVVVAVVALVLGSIGTAVAAPAITKSKVKSIATKIVNKKAPTLSVAHATTADSATNASNLNGQPSTAYLTPSTVANIASGGPFPGTKNWTIPVPAGTYLFNYHTAITPATNDTTVLCYLTSTGNATPFAMEAANFASPFTAAWGSGSGVRTFASPVTVTLHCESGGFVNFSLGFGGISFGYTKVSSGATGTLTPARAGDGVRPAQ